ERALPLYRKIGDVLGEANCIQSIGGIHFRESRNEDARKSFERALPLYRKIGDVLGEANCIQRIGKYLIAEDRVSEGGEQFERANSLYQRINDKYNLAVSLYEHGRLLKEKPGRRDEAKKRLHDAADLFEEMNLPKDVEDCKDLIAELG
ncbi:MAG: hypothetical protein GY868_05760, partial [Deltaproteobacteria bacterium]|nr:hypothetical protein [Deltaproteobacteria bacterium]